jgi:histidinol dehydrogenase
MIKIYKYGEVPNSEIFARDNIASNVEGIVTDIIANVRQNGDKALYEYSKKFDEYLNGGHKIKYTSPFLNLVDECDPKHWTATEQIPQTKEYLESAPVFEKLRTNSEFSEILRMLDK